MTSNLYYVVHLFLIVGGCVLLLRKVADMDGHHGLRVLVLTTIFSSPAIFFAVAYIHAQLYPQYFICVVVE
jgi:hypothetical protein